MKSKKRPLTAEEKQECQALNAIYKAKKRELGITQEKIALEGLGATTQSAASHYLTGKNALNAEAAAVFARYLDIQVRDFSPRLAEEIERMATTVRPKPVANTRGELEPIPVWEDGDPLDPDEVEIPYFNEIQIAAGDGRLPDLEQAKRKIRFPRTVLRESGVDPKNSVCVNVTGNSMEPLIADGAIIGVDLSVSTITDGEIYALKHDDMLRVKFVYRLPGGGIRLRSFNRDEYPDEEYTKDQMRENNLSIMGWVFWWSVMRRRKH
ncbi:LexA family transcriptional regulator [Pseudomonas aeruginosa]|uniref:LexA family transcriptional regulator n=1 Tax=Pseudomonas aeruginosa TaxID=287 RepID=UPI003CC5A9A8|nr:helix-turn-helix transcriptional regulator [Pseudomonas aeruginosa]